MELGFRIPIVGESSDSLRCIPDSRTQDPPFHKKKCPRIPDPKKVDPFITLGESRACITVHFIRLCFARIFLSFRFQY